MHIKWQIIRYVLQYKLRAKPHTDQPPCSLRKQTAYSEVFLIWFSIFFIYPWCFPFSTTYTKLCTFYKVHICQTYCLFLRNAAHKEKVYKTHIKLTYATKGKEKRKSQKVFWIFTVLRNFSFLSYQDNIGFKETNHCYNI